MCAQSTANVAELQISSVCPESNRLLRSFRTKPVYRVSGHLKQPATFFVSSFDGRPAMFLLGVCSSVI